MIDIYMYMVRTLIYPERPIFGWFDLYHPLQFVQLLQLKVLYSQWMEDTYGATLIPERPAQGELWSPDVIKLAVEHEKEGLLGEFLGVSSHNSFILIHGK